MKYIVCCGTVPLYACSSENLSYPAMIQANEDIFKIGRIAMTTNARFGIPAEAFSCIVSKEPYKPTPGLQGRRACPPANSPAAPTKPCKARL